MFFPIRSDRRLQRTPWVNYTLVAANVIAFLLTGAQVQEFGPAVQQGFPLEQILGQLPAARLFLWPDNLHVHQFLTYQFLHESWAHLLGNMIFLYVFGNAVEDRLGRLGYLFFYLSGGVFAGVGHLLVETSPVLGASGAVAGVTGAYLALFPLTNITIIYWFFIAGAFEVSGFVLILFQVAQDLTFQLIGIGSVAYLAHLTGYLYGFVIGMALLVSRFLSREPVDLLSLIDRWRRRSEFRRLARQGVQPWDHVTVGEPPKAEEARRPVTAQEQAIIDQRARIIAALGRHHMPAAAQLYAELLKVDAQQVMGQQQQLDLANQLMAESRYDAAAAAYELFLRHYSNYPQLPHVQLILGLIYSRYLDRKKRAKELLSGAVHRLSGEDQALARQVLAEID
jgi:membrane associated rhomboid family serine protease